ncbi:MAG: four helix bundle protein, partial [Bradymonadaceae bacterium]
VADDLSDDWTSNHLGHQMMKAATSVGAHVREGSRARSEKEFVSKLDGAIQEADEAQFWLELVADSQRGNVDDLRRLYRQADRVIGMLTSMAIQVKSRL